MKDSDYMLLALEEANQAREAGEMPVGCVVVKDDAIIARAHNRCEEYRDATAHAEMLAIRQASCILGDWRLSDCTLYVTLEPCPMCAGAIMQARVGRLVYGADDPEQGCAGSLYRITEDPAFPHFCQCDGGVESDKCGKLINEFFHRRRRKMLQLKASDNLESDSIRNEI